MDTGDGYRIEDQETERRWIQEMDTGDGARRRS